MVSRKRMASQPNGVAYVEKVPASQPIPPIDIPSVLRFPVAAFLNMMISGILYSFTSNIGAGDLASVSRRRDEWWEILLVFGAKIAELAVGWFGEYDGYDMASLTFLAHLPTNFLLFYFYHIRPSTVVFSLVTDIISTYVPFYLLRPLAPVHYAEAPRGAVANRFIINDFPILIYTTLLAAGIHGIVLFASFTTWLPIHLVLYFDGIRDISFVHESQLPWLILASIPTGLAARTFLFSPAAGAKRDLGDIKNLAFKPETATLSETIYYNLWGYSKRTRTLIQRTAILAATIGLYTWFQIWFTVDGTEWTGAAGWGAVWSAATTLTGAAFWWVTDVSGIAN